MHQSRQFRQARRLLPVIVLTALVSGACGADEPPSADVMVGDSPATTTTRGTSNGSETPTPDVLTGLPGMADYPVRLRLPDGTRVTPQDRGMWRIVSEDGETEVMVLALESLILDGDRERPPRSVTAIPGAIRAARPELQPSRVRATTVDGRTATGFQIRGIPMHGELECPVGGGYCMDQVPQAVHQVVAVETPEQPLWLTHTYRPGYDDTRAARAWFAELVAGITVK